MAQPMLQVVQGADNASENSTTAVPHLLPCRIHHDGPVGDNIASFWSPQKEEDGTLKAYFRGRRLHGQAVAVPAGYRGVVGVRQDSPREAAQRQHPARPDEVIDVDASAEEREAQRQQRETGGLVTLAEFAEFIVWEHQRAAADAATDPYVRGMEEWLALAEKIHDYSTETQA